MLSQVDIVRVTYPLQQRFGFLFPLLCLLQKQSSSETKSGMISIEDLSKKYYKKLSSPAEKWQSSPGVPYLPSGFSPRGIQDLLFWLRNLGLIERGGLLLTDLAEAGLAIWYGKGEKDPLGSNPLLLESLPRRLYAWTTLLGADGLALLVTWASFGPEPQTLATLGRRIRQTIERTKLFSRPQLATSLHEGLRDFDGRLEEAVKDDRLFRKILAPRIGPLVDLGLASAERRAGYFRLSNLGIAHQATILTWLTELPGLELNSIHLRRAGSLAAIGSALRPVDSHTLVNALPCWIRQTAATWGERRQQPLWESLLLAGCEATKEDRYFELQEGLAALSQLREKQPGSVTWVAGRQMDERYFRLAEVIDQVPSSEGDCSNGMAIPVTMPVNEKSTAIPPSSPMVTVPSPNLATDAEARTLDWLWLRDIIEDQLPLEEFRPSGIPLLGAQTSLRHLRDRLHGLREQSPEKQTEFFFGRLKHDAEAPQHSGLYGSLVEEIASAFGTKLPVIGHLRERLRKLQPDAASEIPILCALHRVSVSRKALRAHYPILQELWRPQLLANDRAAVMAQARLLLRDMLLDGGVSLDALTDVFSVKHAQKALTALVRKLLPDRGRNISLFQVSLEGELPLTFRPLLDGGQTLLAADRPGRNNLGEQLELREVRPPLLTSLDSAADGNEGISAELSLRFTGSATVTACDSGAARRRARNWVQAQFAQRSLAWANGDPCAAGPWEIRTLEAEPEANHDHDNTYFSEPHSDAPSLSTWRRQTDPALLRRLSRIRPSAALRRSLDYWLRAQRAIDPLIRFSCLYSGIEHLLTRGQRGHLTDSLAGALTLPILRRRSDALVREISNRLLRSAARMPVESEDAKQLHVLVLALCGDEPLRDGPQFLTVLREKSELAKDLANKLDKYAPSLAQSYQFWLNALLPNKPHEVPKSLKRLLDREYRHIVQQFGVCYDLRNRVQHDGDHFPGIRLNLLSAASDVLRAYLRLLLERLLTNPQRKKHKQSPSYALRLLNLELEDLYEVLYAGKPGYSEHFFRVLATS